MVTDNFLLLFPIIYNHETVLHAPFHHGVKHENSYAGNKDSAIKFPLMSMEIMPPS